MIGRGQRQVEHIVAHLKARATQHLKREQLWPPDERPVWAKGCWKVFLDAPNDVVRAIQYVNRNPEKEGKPRQRWSFVTPFAD
ncbi:MAG: hypothetical protein A2V70_08715 [Planctomycetes bacterium RBG_13_63_9]|nr:MAG: hypothetical protein A2V70_08715 [Planctomycetes bacterium RBG_13_63_9]